MQTYYEFTDFLASLPAETVLLLAIISLLLFTFGLLLGWLLQKRSTRAYRKQFVLAKREQDEYQTRLSAADEEQKSLAKELVQLTTEKDELLVQLRNLRATNETLTGQVTRQRADNEQLAATNQSFATTIEDLNDQVIGLKTRNAHLLTEPGGNTGAADSTLEQRLSTLEATLARLQAPVATLPADPPSALNLGRATHQVRIGESLPASGAGHSAADDKRDELTRINAIGPFNQEKLYAAGITTYSQIAAWSDSDLEDFAARIGYVAELMRIQDWVGQAKQLAAEDSRKQPLTLLPAIDDEMATVLRDAGIQDLADLADTPSMEIEAIIFQSGHQAVAGAEDWPQEAARWLADHGNVSPVG